MMLNSHHEIKILTQPTPGSIPGPTLGHILDFNTCTATVTCGYLYTGDNFKKFGNEKSIQQSKILLDFNPPSENEVVTEKYLPIYPYSDKIKSEFDWEKYQSQLSTKSLGQIGRDHRFTSLACKRGSKQSVFAIFYAKFSLF